MPGRDVYMRRDLECVNGHRWSAEILQREHTVEEGGVVTNVTTPQGALDNVRCPQCGEPPKDPNA